MTQTPAVPRDWDPPAEAYDLRTGHGVQQYWAHIHRCGRAYANRVAAERVVPMVAGGPSRRVVAPIIDLD